MSRARAVRVPPCSLLLLPSGVRDSYATNSKSTSLYHGSVALSTSQLPRRPAPLSRGEVGSAKGTLFVSRALAVTPLGVRPYNLLLLRSGVQDSQATNNQKTLVLPRFRGTAHETTTKTPCSASSEQSGICQRCCPHSQHHLIGHFAEKMVCGCGQTTAALLSSGEHHSRSRHNGQHRDHHRSWFCYERRWSRFCPLWRLRGWCALKENNPRNLSLPNENQ
jgi:hypothetical protein